jgi:type II secretory pathway pseudopilin PulG
VELAVVIVIIGVLAAFGVPRFLKSVERAKAAESFNYLSAVRDAQERYIAKEGVYAGDTSQLDITQSAPRYFSLGSLTPVSDAGGNPTWSMVLTRDSTTSSYGAYQVKFTQDGFDTSSNICNAGDISPMGTQGN